MIYCTSDLHGFPPERFRELLRKADFGGDDFLYVLGDVIDRGSDGGIALLRWMMCRPNAELLLGNHEAMLLSCDFLFDEITPESIQGLNDEKMRLLTGWVMNGADTTIEALNALRKRDADAVQAILEYLREAPLWETVTAGGRDFVLCHAGLGGFRQGKKLADYGPHDLLWTRPRPSDRYFRNAFTVFGHTPTQLYGCPGRAFRTDTWIDIDTGAGHGGSPMLLRLDDMKEFYLD